MRVHKKETLYLRFQICEGILYKNFGDGIPSSHPHQQCFHPVDTSQVCSNIFNQGPIFRTFFPGKILAKIPRKIFPQKMFGKNGIFRGKSFEKSFFQEIPWNSLSAGKMHEKSAPELTALPSGRLHLFRSRSSGI
jgi:hypothetical protein